MSPDRFASWLIGSGIRADLDGDGFGDLLAYGSIPGRDKQQRPHIFWGGPRGLDARTPPTPIQAPVTNRLASHRTVAGDFNGDGAADVAMSSPHGDDDGGADLAVLYGPFSRAAVPARHTIQPSPTGEELWRMTVDRVDGRRPTGLVVYGGDDGEQAAGWLLTAGPDGLSKQGRRLNEGMAAAFGDFDGDGARDVAVGDDGGRNNEPGFETEPPSVDKTLTIYYGDGRQAVFKGIAGPAVSGDFDGDGHDDLAFGGVVPSWNLTSYIPARIFWGGSDGLRAGENVDGVGRAAPLAAGDYDGDGDDELAFAHRDDDLKIVITDGKRALASFDTLSLGL
ncbi:FG-GAP-like repeat-containing protein [Streptosporangium sp. NPDC002544]|uniref:FG-GAP-like repeat-containing protein n=1 Tax=Streptosporangium sp. NPDC002544 TaxID=3154538 RepID=UPI00332B2129